MKIIPAIDIIDGKCVRLTKGDYSQQTTYDYSPVELARNYEKLGFKFLHLVDLDGAKAGQVRNLETLKQICSETNLNIDFGGGVKTEADLKAVLDAGAKQVTIGSLAVKDKTLFKSWIEKYGADKFILGADVHDLKIAVGGWLETSSIDLFDFIEEYVALGISNVLCTDISKDGTLTGPSFDLYNQIMEQFPQIDLIASGGVSKIEDVMELDQNKIPAVVIGKAIYENKIDLEELAQLAQSNLI
ncbi:MAG: 1-(5-phosphoribosyl)-5-[(5-phosphoribosylamino)methylideneamino]imidazole-4-carboxamide isomerase [Flavobacteriia bacterium]|jgi:phosphoribosylformimino-5-aminoimidazole carboxamide ribotide isomerase